MAAIEVFPCLRSRTDALLRGEALSRRFHTLFRLTEEQQIKKKVEKKKSRKKSKSKAKERKQQREKSPELPDVPPSASVDLHGNASAFTVYAKVRQSVLVQGIRDASRLYHLANSGPGSDSESDDDGDEKNKEAQIKIPKIVGLGLHGVFELIRETRFKYPELCVKSLRALLDLLQGQQPEAMKHEPMEVVDKLFVLLMMLATDCVHDVSVDGHSLTSLACSALISLTIALGDTGKLLTAIKAMLMSSPGLALQKTQVPGILSLLQKSVQALLLGRAQLPDWFSSGVRTQSLTNTFVLSSSAASFDDSVENCAIASDGNYLYILNKKGLLKVGSGYGSTIKGCIVSHKKDFHGSKNLWLAYAGGKLLCRQERSGTSDLVQVDTNTLEPCSSCSLDGHGLSTSILFSDGENIGQIAPSKELDSFVVCTFSPQTSPMKLLSEIPLKLTRKCLDMFGSSPFDTEVVRRTISTGFDEDSLTIISGKEFSLIKTVGGKVLYTGKAAALGIKQGGPAPGKWAELPITKSPKIIQVAAGHDGMHALMVSDDGSAFFVGTAKRGEDGDAGSAKVRRQPKPVKPKKMIRLENKFIAYAACNSGSSAVLTKDGEVYMFGKDTAHCDHASGHVTDLKDVSVTQIALGKAHAVALTSKGQIFTFGINNKGQCGRDFNQTGTRESNNVNMTEEEEENDGEDVMCPPGKHKWEHNKCMICTLCRECTGYGVSCISSAHGDRNPGMPCGCGAGDAGCSECGVCRVCAGEKLGMEELDDRGLLEVIGKGKDALPLEMIIGGGRPGGKSLDGRGRINQLKKMELRRAQKIVKERKRQRDAVNDPEADYTKLVSLAPAEVVVGSGDIPVVQIACGVHHTVVLLQNGDVYTFGSNSYGQLGLGDNNPRGMPTKVPLPLGTVQIAAGSHHTVILLTSGQVYTCGDFQKGALGRVGPEDSSVKSKKGAWNCVPGAVPGVGARFGRRATWIGASTDQTFMRIDESLINALTLQRSNIFASQTCIGLIPRGEDNAGIMKCLMISKADGSCKSFSGEEQVDLSNQVVCLDPVYEILWGYCPQTHEIHSYNVLVPEARNLFSIQPGYPNILSPELAVPTHMGCSTTRSHCALHMLGCLDSLTIGRQLKLEVLEEAKEKTAQSKVYTKEDYSVVNRFESHGGGWGYSGHSVEAIRFMCDTEILLGGFGLFGGRGEYFGRIKLFELGVDGGENEGDGELLAETDEIPFECGAREKFCMLFEEPVPLMANNWYVAWARISGPSSDCGSSGQPSVITEDQVVFKFKSSKKSNNGTDVNAGQIPQILYRLPSRDSPSVVRRTEHVDPAHILSQEFSHNVTEQCFESLLQLLDWSWTASYHMMEEVEGVKGEGYQAALAEMSQLVYISRACLRLLTIYVTEIYPDGVTKKKIPPESSGLAQRIGDARELLRRILAEVVHASKFKVFLGEPSSVREFHLMRDEILMECHNTFRSCFHAFYPTGQLKWWCLCDLLCQTEPVFEKKESVNIHMDKGVPNVAGVGRLLAAVMEALCHPAIKLTALMPINCEPETEAVLRRQSMCMDDNTNSVARLAEGHRYPVLASHMSYRMEVDSVGGVGTHISFKEVLDRLLMLVALPVRQTLAHETEAFPPHLVANTCSLLATIISELAASAMGLEVDLDTRTRPLLVTPSRFTRMSQSAFWNAGNGSPDAVAFSVDRFGVVIAGICVYGGTGTYEFEAEFLEEMMCGEGAVENQGEMSHSQRWSSLEIVKGKFGPEDTVNDIAEIKFERPIPIRVGSKYAVKLRNNGPRSFNGDGGMAKVKCSDGTTFTFSACSLSINGTNHLRGQIPQILYYSAPQEGEQQSQHSKSLAELQARKNAIDITGAICRTANDLLHRAHNQPVDEAAECLGQSYLFASLLPQALAYVGPVAAQDPRGAVQVLYLIQEILPAVINLTKQLTPVPLTGSVSESSMSDLSALTTSSNYAIVESDHPYKPASVANYKVEFPNTVRWMAIEFDPQCSTAQPEDSLQLYIPAWRTRPDTSLDSESAHSVLENSPDLGISHWPVLHKFHGVLNWPKQAIILPGNEVLFSLETASDYMKDEKASFFGFKCTVIGYDWNTRPEENVMVLEKELAYLGGMCAAALMRRDIPLPPVTMEEMDEDMDVIEEGAHLVFEAHSQLLSKGFALSQPPTIMQALEGNLPFCWQSNERAFLKDFVSCTPGTSGGRLARWLQPDSYLDPKQCEIICCADELKCSWPTLITILTRDQYTEIVNVPNLKVEVKAVPVDRKENFGDDMKRMRRLSRPDDGDMTFGGLPAPQITIPYEVTIKDRKDVFHAITVMKGYENYSFEELRFAAPTVPRPSENMLVRANNDGTFTANWTPACVGLYTIHVIIDGFVAGEPYKVEVKEPPQGAPPPTQTTKKTHPANKMRRFIAKYSAGLRVRAHPTLQSEQVGIIKPDGIISFVDEVHNDDGVWLRLSSESMLEWCNSGSAAASAGNMCLPEAWCLQYNQHLGKTLLAPVEEPKSIVDEMVKEAIARKLPEYIREATRSPKGPGIYQVVNCGNYGHNVRSRPSLKAAPIGILTRGKKIVATENMINSEGVWVKLDPASCEQYCDSKDTEAWSLSSDHNHAVYLLHETELGPAGKDPFSFNTLPMAGHQGFDFSSTNYAATFPFLGHKNQEGFGRSRSLPAHGFTFAGTEGASSGIIPSFGSASGITAPFSQGPGAAFASNWVESSAAGAGSGSMRPRSGSTPFFSPAFHQVEKASEASGAARKGSDPGISRLHVRDPMRDIPVELQGVSVKELVRALGESRANGNGPTPQPSPPGSPRKTSRSSSPCAAGSSRSASPATSSDSRRGSTSPSPKGTLTKNETFQTPPSSPRPTRRMRGKLEKEPSMERSSLSPTAFKSDLCSDIGSEGAMAGGAGGSIGSPRFGSPVRTGSPGRRGSLSNVHFGALSSSPPRSAVDGTGQMAGNFNIGSGSPKDETAVRLSPKTGRKDRGRQLRSKRERALSPSARDIPITRARSSSASLILDRAREPVKQALSPSVAECLRAVFAAFMWHEGIVHDAMACASFLKFHPDLTKVMSHFVKGKQQERVRQRHATDSSKEKRDSKARRKAGHGNINEARVRFKLEPQVQDPQIFDHLFSLDKLPLTGTPPRRLMERHKSEGGGSKFLEFDIERDKDGGGGGNAGGKEEMVLPPTLQHLVYFWEELSLAVLKQVVSQDAILPSPAVQARMKKMEKKDEEKKEKKSKRKKDAKGVVKGCYFGEAVAHMLGVHEARGGGAGAGGGAALDQVAAAAAAAAVERRAAAAQGVQDRETMCELCGNMFPNPVTYHMRQNHPGCGRYACGKGYNSGGNFCGGWAGNCGEGGMGGSSWYLMCDKCRDKYLREKRHAQKEKEKARKLKKKSGSSGVSGFARNTAIAAPLESHLILKDNAMFLLDLASASGLSLPKHNYKKQQHLFGVLGISRGEMYYLPSVSETLGTELEPFPPVPFQYLSLQNAHSSDSAFAEDFLIDDEERVFVRSGSLSISTRRGISYRPRLPTEPRHSPLARSGSLGQDVRPFSHILPDTKDTRLLVEETKPVVKSAGTSPDSEQENHKKSFHRSVSEYASEEENGEREFVLHRAVSVSARRRNNSGGVSADGGVSLLKHPSAAMTKLINSVDGSDGVPGNGNGERALQRPVMEFIMQRHDLDGLQLAMKQALRKAACRVFAMQAFNWLLRTVVQQTSLHDLLWFFVVSLMPVPDEEEESDNSDVEKEKEKEKRERKDQEEMPLCEHPLTDICVAGKAVAPLPDTFHSLLQTISDVMLHLPMGSALQRMSVQCYCLRFMQSDHQFLHESHVFSNISRILSKSEEENDETSIDSSMVHFTVSCLKDLTATTEIKASSRQAMIGSLSDNSTETFWESGDEDRSRVKMLNLICSDKSSPSVVYIHIDNSRDLANKVNSITISAGTNNEDMRKIRSMDIEGRFAGWINCSILPEGRRYILLEFKGPDQSLRVRQVKVLGTLENVDSVITVKKTAAQILQDNCEAETLKVFRILTSQVFGRLINNFPMASEGGGDEWDKEDKTDGIDADNDLKEHMVSILFSRNKLSHLQKQVCLHIVQGIRKEAARIREEWENCGGKLEIMDDEYRGSDVYCFELLSMVEALSGSAVGRRYLAQQHSLIQELFSLLHTASPRIQRQIVTIIRRVLPDIKPPVLANLLSVPSLPPADYSIVSVASKEDGDETFDPQKPGILDVFLACISKALQVQIKTKMETVKHVMTSMIDDCLPKDPIKYLGPRWWLRGSISPSLAKSIVCLTQDMAAGNLSEAWALVTKAAIAENILNLTKLDVAHRQPATCTQMPTLWLALASLCVLGPDHVERLSSGEWVSSPDSVHGKPRPTCDNHDDSMTSAIILCSDCGNLCADCDRFLHLPRSKRSHQRQVFKEEEEAIKVDLHEGCGRTKLFWMMALADSKTLKAMVEFRLGKQPNTTTGTCRFCGSTNTTGLLAIGNVCADLECQVHAKEACNMILDCGHLCGGIVDEKPCLPCLHRCRPSDQDALKQDADDMCMICFTEALSAAPAIQLKCGHVFHLHCMRAILEKRWSGPRITFGFSLCPICKSETDHKVLRNLLDPIRQLYEDVRRKALMRLEYEGLHKAEAITTPGAKFYQDPAGFAMERYAYYVCYKCKKAYYGGEARCEEQAGGADDYDPKELVCGGCSDVSRAQMCPKHGSDFLEYKCRYCCAVAVFFCFGTTHFCNACHDDFQRVTNLPKGSLPHCPAGPRGRQLEGDECPLHVQHPPTGEEFALGCGVCRNAHTF